MGKELIAGVDLGGTKIIAGVIYPDGRLAGTPVEIPTKAEEPGESIIGRMVDAIKRAVSGAGAAIDEICGIGIGSPGPLDINKGIILNTANLPTLNNFNLKEKISGALNIPVYVNNDANCFALGECFFGAIKDAKDAFGVTLGTGFGCGIVIDRKIYTGATDTAAEIDLCPYLGGTLEDYISGRGVVRIYKEIKGEDGSPPDIADKARNGDADAVKTWEEFGMHLGVALSYAVNILDPEVIIVGGSLSNAYDLFSEKMIGTLNKNINPIPRENIRIIKAKLGNNAGLIGACCLVLQESQKHEKRD